jgi:hypothetical protein
LNAVKLSGHLIEAWPRLNNRIIYREMDLTELPVFPGDLVVSAHACGALTDLILDRAVDCHARVAVLPCCHDLKTSSTGGLEGWMDPALAVDTVRAFRLKAMGYRIVTHKIPETITPKNRLLMGEYLPIEQTCQNRQGNGPHDAPHKRV